MSLDTATLTSTNTPDIAARTVESRASAMLYAPIKAACEAFWAAFGLSYTFYADGTGASLVLHADTIELLAAMSQADPSTGWPADYYSDEETRLGDKIMDEYEDQPTPLFGIGP